MKRDKDTTNNLQNTTQKTKYRTILIQGVHWGSPEMEAVHVPL